MPLKPHVMISFLYAFFPITVYNRRPYVENLSVHRVSDVPSVLQLMRVGAERRATASTKLNEHSSRSHAIFMMRFVQTDFRAAPNEGGNCNGADVVQTRCTYISFTHLSSLPMLEMIFRACERICKCVILCWYFSGRELAILTLLT